MGANWKSAGRALAALACLPLLPALAADPQPPSCQAEMLRGVAGTRLGPEGLPAGQINLKARNIYDVAGIGFNGRPNARVRLTVSGATAVSGTNLLDNIRFNATVAP